MTPDPKAVFIDEMQQLGVDLSTVAGREQFRADIAWARQSRMRCEKVLGAALIVTVGGVFSIIGGWLLHSLAQTIGKLGGGQ
jgi:hypothetical protein